jgi:NIMA (never in mitosis gene a)-related kinase
LGLAHIHSKHILHRDLKSMNLFIDDKNRIKIGDLGVARVLGHSTYAHTVVGTPYCKFISLLLSLVIRVYR